MDPHKGVNLRLYRHDELAFLTEVDKVEVPDVSRTSGVIVHIATSGRIGRTMGPRRSTEHIKRASTRAYNRSNRNTFGQPNCWRTR